MHQLRHPFSFYTVELRCDTKTIERKTKTLARTLGKVQCQFDGCSNLFEPRSLCHKLTKAHPVGNQKHRTYQIDMKSCDFISLEVEAGLKMLEALRVAVQPTFHEVGAEASCKILARSLVFPEVGEEKCRCRGTTCAPTPRFVEVRPVVKKLPKS